MKQDQKTLNTKKALAASLKKFMKQKPLSKITVSQLISDCNVNRKTFYYHFEDIYDLLKWTLEEEAIEVVKQYDLLVDYPEVITFVMDYVEENQHILNCAYDSLGREGMKRFLYADFIGILSTLIEGIEQQENIHADAEFKQFLCEFYTEATQWYPHQLVPRSQRTRPRQNHPGHPADPEYFSAKCAARFPAAA